MKTEATIDGHPARLTIQGTRLLYETVGAESIDREFSIMPLDAGAYSVFIENRSYTVIAASSGEISVNGRRISVEILDPRRLCARKGAGAGEGRQNIVAMMPGKVVRLMVAPGDMVVAGQGVIVVEAMKMQNEIVSPRDGRIAELKTNPDATVSPGEVLMVIE